MFPRILFADQERTLMLNWFGKGALIVANRFGRKRRAHPLQKQFLLAIVGELHMLGIPPAFDSPVYRALFGEYAEALEMGPLSSPTWQIMLHRSPAEHAVRYAAVAS